MGLERWLSWEKPLLCDPDDRSSAPAAHHNGRERTDNQNLSSDLHRCACIHLHPS